MSRQLSREEQEAVLCLLSVRSHHKRPSDKDGGSDGFDDASLCGTRSKAQFRPSEDINDTKTTTGYPDRVSRYLNQTEQFLTPVTTVDHSARTMMMRRIPPAINKKKKKKMMVCVWCYYSCANWMEAQAEQQAHPIYAEKWPTWWGAANRYQRSHSPHSTILGATTTAAAAV